MDWNKYPDGKEKEFAVEKSYYHYNKMLCRVFPFMADFKPVSPYSETGFSFTKKEYPKPSVDELIVSEKDKREHKSPPRPKDLVYAEGRSGIILWIERDFDEAKVLFFDNKETESYSLDRFEFFSHGKVKWRIWSV